LKCLLRLVLYFAHHKISREAKYKPENTEPGNNRIPGSSGSVFPGV
jgi:hypothetical protein